jgi:hypothetical protein
LRLFGDQRALQHFIWMHFNTSIKNQEFKILNF